MPQSHFALKTPQAVVTRVARMSREPDKVLQAFALRETGISAAEIARRLGMSPQTPRKWFKQAQELGDANASDLRDAILTEDEIASLRARIARKSVEAEDYKTALEAMRDDAKRQGIDVEVTRQERVSLVVRLAQRPRAERLAEIQQLAGVLGLGQSSAMDATSVETSNAHEVASRSESFPTGDVGIASKNHSCGVRVRIPTDVARRDAGGEGSSEARKPGCGTPQGRPRNPLLTPNEYEDRESNAPSGTSQEAIPWDTDQR